MKRQEKCDITYFLREIGPSIAIKFSLFESGFYEVARKKTYYHPMPSFNRMFLFSRGGGTVILNGVKVGLQEQIMYLLPVNQSFTATYHVGSEFFYFHFQLQDHYRHDVFDRTKRVLRVADRPELFNDIVHGYVSAAASDFGTWQVSLFGAIMGLGVGHMPSFAKRYSMSQKYHNLLVHIQEKCQPDFRVGELAHMERVSRSALSHGFRKDMGIPLKKYIIDVLMHKAREMLVSSSLSVKEIAYQLGYNDPYYFQRIFRKYTGETPLAYRRQTTLAYAAAAPAASSSAPTPIKSARG